MAPGPPILKGNRFSILDNVPKKKKRQNTAIPLDAYPNLSVPKTEDPKYIVIAATNPDKPLSSYSCFAIHRSLLAINKDILNITQLRDGRLLLLVKNKNVAKNFILSKSLPGICDIKVDFHMQLNCVKGTIFAPFLNDLSVDEIVKELKPIGVVEAYKFKKQVEGKEIPSGVVLLTFDLYTLPSNIVVAWNKVKVNQFFPSPMRCKTCQYLGHTAKYCKRAPSCVTCGLPPHSPNNCNREFCVNCLDKHPANSKDCPKFIQAKDILKIKTLNKCSMGEAAKIYKEKIPLNPSNSITFATVLRNSDNNKNNNSNNDCLENSTLNKAVTYQRLTSFSSHSSSFNPVINSSNIKSNNNSNKQQLNEVDNYSFDRPNINFALDKISSNVIKDIKKNDKNNCAVSQLNSDNENAENLSHSQNILSFSESPQLSIDNSIQHNIMSISSSRSNSPQLSKSLHSSPSPVRKIRSNSPPVFTDDSEMST